ncbi:Xanthine and CO dehydrogenases maturation factor, XdhC/CoxF family [hydrothermal vent metagenome]|uniref:Xanthine and CO dehydrogenases maturation factor, XdhC/CoxF family n=1 Tax=hydrothermal vent metagenome TaxID=652676 RepID=A0A3B1E172_9ZZZZ
MKNVLEKLFQAIQSQTPVIDTLLVETKGSTPQKAGARMLVFADGSQVGTLGGGCVEAEVKRRALQLLDKNEREVLTFLLDNDYGWDDGLICGGKMRMLVDPVIPQSDLSYFEELQNFQALGKGYTEAILLDSEKGTARWLIDEERKVIVQRGSGSQPATVLENLRPSSARSRPYVQQGISYLPKHEECRLIIVGGGHVGQWIAQLAVDVSFRVWVIDDREEYCNAERFPKAARLIVGDIDATLGDLAIDENTFCVIVTRGHHHDEEALFHLAETSASYVGMIGSKRKIRLIMEDLIREGISLEALQRVQAPIGFDIGSQTVPEIAISIVAELIAHRNLGANRKIKKATSLKQQTEDPM